VDSDQAQRLARVAGVLVVISILAGGFAEVFVPGKLLIPLDPAATARNMADSALLFRCSFAIYLVEAICDVTLALILYLLLRPVSQSLTVLLRCGDSGLGHRCAPSHDARAPRRVYLLRADAVRIRR